MLELVTLAVLLAALLSHGWTAPLPLSDPLPPPLLALDLAAVVLGAATLARHAFAPPCPRWHAAVWALVVPCAFSLLTSGLRWDESTGESTGGLTALARPLGVASSAVTLAALAKILSCV